MRLYSQQTSPSTLLAFPSITASKEEVREWAEKLFESKKLDKKHAKILEQQEITGESLLTLTEQKLIAPPYSMPGGPATILATAAEQALATVLKERKNTGINN